MGGTYAARIESRMGGWRFDETCGSAADGISPRGATRHLRSFAAREYHEVAVFLSGEGGKDEP